MVLSWVVIEMVVVVIVVVIVVGSEMVVSGVMVSRVGKGDSCEVVHSVDFFYLDEHH